LDMGLTTVYSLPTTRRTEPLAKQGNLCMPWAEGIRVSRMRENRTSGLKRAEAIVAARHTDIEPHTGKP
jgi:hypothetical protein